MQKLPDLEAWAIFARIAREGSFAGAARALGLSTATVSKATARLEARIGAALLSRTSRQVALTALGRTLAARAGALLEAAETLESDAADETAGVHGLVRLAAPMSFGVNYVAPLLPALFSRHPGLAIELSLSDEVVDLVAGGFDLALRMSASGSASLRTRRICGIATRLVAAPAWVARHGAPATPADLRPEQVFGYLGGRATSRLALRHATSGAESSVATLGALRVNNGDAMLPALLAGSGIAMLPEFIVWEALRAGTLVPVLPEWRTPDVSLHIVTPPGGPRPKRVVVVIEELARRLAHAPWADAGPP